MCCAPVPVLYSHGVPGATTHQGTCYGSHDMAIKTTTAAWVVKLWRQNVSLATSMWTLSSQRPFMSVGAAWVPPSESKGEGWWRSRVGADDSGTAEGAARGRGGAGGGEQPALRPLPRLAAVRHRHHQRHHPGAAGALQSGLPHAGPGGCGLHSMPPCTRRLHVLTSSASGRQALLTHFTNELQRIRALLMTKCVLQRWYSNDVGMSRPNANTGIHRFLVFNKVPKEGSVTRGV